MSQLLPTPPLLPPRHLAHVTHILALLLFEPEDRRSLDIHYPGGVPQSIPLLAHRRDRGVRTAFLEADVDRNQSLLLGDGGVLIRRLLELLRVMNWAPAVGDGRRGWRVMGGFPCVGDTLRMLGLRKLEGWDEVGRLEAFARTLLEDDNFHDNDGDDV